MTVGTEKNLYVASVVSAENVINWMLQYWVLVNDNYNKICIYVAIEHSIH